MTTNMGIWRGFHWQMTHIESIIDVVHLHNIEQYKSSPPITPHWEVEDLWFQSLDQHFFNSNFSDFKFFGPDS